MSLGSLNGTAAKQSTSQICPFKVSNVFCFLEYETAVTNTVWQKEELSFGSLVCIKNQEPEIK